MGTTSCRNDALVQLLNKEGYQPIVLPRTNVRPPEMYTYAEDRLIRRGPLADYLPEGLKMPALRSGEVPDLQHKESSRKHLGASASFLEDALRCIGVTSTPKIDLSFARGCELTFSFTEVTYTALNSSDVEILLGNGLRTGAIPPEYVAGGRLHIAYDYAYAKVLTMRSAENIKFNADLKGAKVQQFIDVGGQAHVEAQSETIIKFKTLRDHPAAFAFKVGQLEQRESGWVFFPEEIMGKGFTGDEGEKIPYLLERGVVLRAEES